MKLFGGASGIACAILIIAAPALAAPHEIRIALRDGKLHSSDLVAAVCKETHLPACDFSGGDIDVSFLGGSLLIRAMNKAMGDGCRITLDREALVLHADLEKLPGNCDDANRAIRLFTAEMTPQATARQARRWGLFLPACVTEKRPLVVLIHGLDSEKGELSGLGDLIESAGYQIAYFSYPDDQPISDSADFFATKMIELRRQFPALKVDLVAHSMGGLVARAYIEGDAYAGGVDHLFLVGTPNAGSKWATCRFLLEMKEQYQQWRHDPQWSWTWSITDGMGEAGRDLKPGSKFLQHLNSLPRRPGVKYTIIAGVQHPASRISADIAEATSSIVPKKVQSWWGVRQCKSGLASCANHFRHITGTGDGPVKLDSARLTGVTDVAMLPADHLALVCYNHGNPPAAWAVIQDRLAK